MAPRLLIRPAGQVEHAVEVTAMRDDLAIPGLAAGALTVEPAPEGVVFESVACIVTAGRVVPAGTRRLLRYGDRAELGACALWLEPSSSPDRDGTRALAGAILGGVAPVPLAGPSVLVVEGPAAGRRFPLGAGAIAGRGRGIQIPLGDPLASRRHCRFEEHEGAFALQDLRSKNGVTVNGRAAGEKPIALRSGDELRLGRSILLYEDVPRCVAPAPPPDTRGEPQAVARREVHPSSRAAVAAVVLASAALLALAGLIAHAVE